MACVTAALAGTLIAGLVITDALGGDTSEASFTEPRSAKDTGAEGILRGLDNLVGPAHDSLALGVSGAAPFRSPQEDGLHPRPAPRQAHRRSNSGHGSGVANAIGAQGGG